MSAPNTPQGPEAGRVDDVRRVAKAINRAWSHNDLTDEQAWKYLGAKERRHRDNVARAALRALAACDRANGEGENG